MKDFKEYLFENDSKISIADSDKDIRAVTDPELLKKLGGISPKEAIAKDEEDEESDSEEDDRRRIEEARRVKDSYLSGSSPEDERNAALSLAKKKANRSNHSGTYFYHTNKLKGIEDPDEFFHDYISQDGRGKTMTRAEKRMINDYTQTNSANSAYKLNAALRDIKSTKELAKNQKAAKMISDIMRRYPIKHNIITYRKIGLDAIKKIFGKNVTDKELKSMVGVVFCDYGFVSTSTKNSYNGIGPTRSKNAWKCTIYIKKGARALSIREYSNYDNENEVLIDRGSYFKIIKISPARKTMEVQLIQL